MEEFKCKSGEKWKFHKKSGLYVSNLGRVFFMKNRYNGKSKVTYGGIHKSTGYRRVWKGHVHRLVAECFIPNPNNYPEVDHINRDRTDNRVENLRWVTYSENANNTDKTRFKELNKNLGKRVYMYSINGDFLGEYRTTHEAEKIHNISRGNISCCCLGYCKSVGGFKWSYNPPPVTAYIDKPLW